jgi:glycogen synthase
MWFEQMYTMRYSIVRRTGGLNDLSIMETTETEFVMIKASPWAYICYSIKESGIYNDKTLNKVIQLGITNHSWERVYQN